MNLKPNSGIDMSHWQIGIQLAGLNPLPRFAIFKATEDTNGKDDTTLTFASQAKALGIPYGFYHFWRNSNPVMQADNYIQQVKAAGGFERIPPVLDLEIDLTGHAGNLKIWLDSVTNAAGRLPILYGNKETFNTIGNPLPAWFKNYDIWTASYPDNPDIWNWVPPLYSEMRGKREIMWQYCNTYSYPEYPSRDIDLNIAIPEFLAEIGPVTGSGVPTMTLGKAQEAQGKSPSVRAAPDVTGAKVASLTPGSSIDFMELVPGSKVATDKWLRLPNGIHYVNQKVAGVEYMRILSMPTPVTPPPPLPVDPPIVTDKMVITIFENGAATTYTCEGKVTIVKG